ncbi:hypothetical protein TNCV_4660281 [Trichonephila clavipes]|uniref:Uncharacterized protein n=1 Tax=Trichonephila clavipes TaxID=2585209 RepID=A0A8X6SCN9_TRICX|nr:hypothetical protein TNCV_4660281 [Trichonephila clavipes]
MTNTGGLEYVSAESHNSILSAIISSTGKIVSHNSAQKATRKKSVRLSDFLPQKEIGDAVMQTEFNITGGPVCPQMNPTLFWRVIRNMFTYEEKQELDIFHLTYQKEMPLQEVAILHRKDYL